MKTRNEILATVVCGIGTGLFSLGLDTWLAALFLLLMGLLTGLAWAAIDIAQGRL